MSDAVQIVIVTAAAGVALVTLIRPYLRRPDTKKNTPPCANCAASTAPSTPRPGLPGRPAHK